MLDDDFLYAIRGLTHAWSFLLGIVDGSEYLLRHALEASPTRGKRQETIGWQRPTCVRLFIPDGTRRRLCKRSDGRREGKEVVSTCRLRWVLYQKNKKRKNKKTTR